jgi:HK97 family phage major capsid protein
MKPHSYPLIGELVAERPWQILPSKLLEIRGAWQRVLAGGRLSEEELAEIHAAAPQRARTSPGAVAVLPLAGSIFPRATLMAEISGGTSLDAFASAYREVMADPNVSAVVIDVDSPGGSVAMLGETAQILRQGKRKPLVAVANQMAASAAYRLAAQADEFVATPSALVGSVGTYMLHQDLTGALEAEGVKITAIQAGQFKTEDAPFRELTPEAEAAMQRMVDQFQEGFVADVAKGRGVSEAVVRNSYGQGRLLTAQDALAAGMVDRIDTLEKVIGGLLKSGGRSSSDQQREVITLQSGELAYGTLDSATLSASAAASSLFQGGVRMTSQLPAAEARDDEEHEHEGEEPADGPGDDAPTEDSDAGEASSSTPPGAEGRATATAPTTTPKEGKVQTMEELVARQDAILARQREIDADHIGKALEGDPKVEFEGLEDEWVANQTAIDDMKNRARSIAMKGGNADAREGGINAATATDVATARRGAPSVITAAHRNVPENPWAVEEYRKRAGSIDEMGALFAEGARRVNEIVAYETADPDKPRAFVERLLQSADSKDGAFAQRFLLTSSKEFDAAFGKLVMGKPLGQVEQSLINQAVSVGGLGSETPVPVTIDPTVLHTSDGAANPMRQIARVVSITGNTWRGISSDGVTIDYAAELTAVNPQSPTFAAPDVTVVKAQAEVQFSIEVDQDWSALRGELGLMFQEAKDEKEANKFLLGSGTNEPEGLITALIADGTVTVDTASVNTLALADLDLLIDALPPRFDANAQWIGNRSVFSHLRALTSSRTDFWVPFSQGFRNRPTGTTGYTMLDYPVNVASAMSTGVTTGSEKVLILGDFGRGFVIVDRIGLNVELDPLVRDGNGKLTGARALYAYFRNTSALRTAKAFQMLQILHS